MIPKIRKILYTTDLSENSAYVFRYALGSAEVHGAKIDVLYVLQPTVRIFPDMVVDDPSDRKSSVLASIKKRIDDLLEKETRDYPARAGLVSAIEVVDGDPVVRILQTADKIRADVIIMGTHSKGMIYHTFLGSVANHVLQRSRIPVYIIPIPKDKIAE